MNTINPKDKTLAGSIVLVKGTDFLAKQIIMHMAIYARMTGRKPLPYSHAETLIWHYDRLYTVGARGKGTEISLASDYYKGKAYLVLEPVWPLTDHEIEVMYRFYQSVIDSTYQRGNFLAWIGVMKLGWWLGVKGSKKNYCYELAARFSDSIGLWPEGKSLDMVSVYDLFENQNYKSS